MPNIQVPAARADLSSDGSLGYVSVADNTPFYPGCIAWLQDDDGSQRCLIVKLEGSDKIWLRFLPEENQGIKFPQPRDGYSDCTSYTTAKSSRIYQEAQLAPVDPAFDKPVA